MKKYLVFEEKGSAPRIRFRVVEAEEYRSKKIDVRKEGLNPKPVGQVEAENEEEALDKYEMIRASSF